MERFETRLEGGTLKLDFTTSPAMYAGKEGMPHASGGIYLDICGQFTLTAELEGMTLATLDNVTIKPYASFHTMWEISMMSCFGWRTRGTTTRPCMAALHYRLVPSVLRGHHSLQSYPRL